MRDCCIGKIPAVVRRRFFWRGARRVGKSYIARVFGEREYESCLLIDFSNVPKQVLDIFEQDTYDLDTFFMKLSVFYGVKLYRRNTLIIFDEVQMFPRARQLVKHLVADGRYDYLETGSLIMLKQNIENIVLPSEEEHIKMYPLDFEEFLWAMGDDVTFPFVQDCFDKKIEVGTAIHRKAMNLFRQYMLVGGMPQAVLTYVESRDFEKTDVVKRRILDLYCSDVTKFAKGYESKVLSVFDGIPLQLSRHEKKYSLASIEKEARFREYEDSFIWLDEGMFLENVVAQMLKSKGYRLFFYSRYARNDSEQKMELDFLIRKKKKICAVEVKYSDYRRHSSLDKFKKKFPDKTGESYVLYTKDLLVKEDIVYMPVYMALCL